MKDLLLVPPAPGRYGPEGLPPWRRAGGHQRESAAQATAHRLRALATARVESSSRRSATLRNLVTVSESGADPQGRHRPASRHTPGLSSSLGASQRPSPVLVGPSPEETGTEGAERRARPGDRRAQVSQSPIRLSADRAHHVSDVRRRHRQEPRAPRPGETLSATRRGGGPSCIGHATDSLWSIDLFRCESIVLQSYWVLVVMDQFTRRIIGLGVHHGDVDAAHLCRMFSEAMRGQGTPRHLSTDHAVV